MNDQLKEIINRRNFVILDTETTGLRRPAEIIDIAIVNPQGQPLLNTLLKPRGRIPADASAVHGLIAEMCDSSPDWPTMKPVILQKIRGKDILVYNATYDRHMMHCSDEMFGLEKTDYHQEMNWYCVMEAYADYWREWDSYHGNNRWQRLTTAIEQQGLQVDGAHRALGDCLMTLALVRHLTNECVGWKLIDSLTTA